MSKEGLNEQITHAYPMDLSALSFPGNYSLLRLRSSFWAALFFFRHYLLIDFLKLREAMSFRLYIHGALGNIWAFVLIFC